MGKGLIAEVCIKSWALSELICIQSDRRKNRAVLKYFWTEHLITGGRKLIMSKIRTAKKETWWCAHTLITFLTHRKFTSQGCLYIDCICLVIYIYFHRCYQSGFRFCISKCWKTDLMRTSAQINTCSSGTTLWCGKFVSPSGAHWLNGMKLHASWQDTGCLATLFSIHSTSM